MRKSFRLFLVLAASGCLIVSACEDQGDELPGGMQAQPATFSEVQATILTPTCATANCHASVQPNGLDLSAGNAYAAIVDVPSQYGIGTLVEPGDADNSIFMQRLEGSIPGFSTMPPSGTLSAGQLERVRSWIDAGAPNN